MPQSNHTLIIKILLPFFGILLGFLLLETAFRFRHYYVRNIGFFDRLQFLGAGRDSLLGWKGKEYGLNLNAKKNIIVVGDSFTEGMGLETEYLYPTILAKKLSLNMLAYGGQGYGTLQQLLVLEKLVQKHPADVVILQLCSNDFINNSFELEKLSYWQNSAQYRPYLEGDEIVYRNAGWLPEWFLLISKFSRTIHFIAVRTPRLLSVMRGNSSVELVIAEQGVRFAPFANSLLVTKKLIDKIKTTAAPARLILFMADLSFSHEFTLFKKIASDLGVTFVTDVSYDLEKARQKGEKVTIDDNVHWSKAGHLLAANALSPYIDKLVK
ncbi:MAG TPA: hypothetical protein PKD37_00490 [Oligoflexia bacterium]|nr:hypothetical protein [Oligoflexia bacterium]HMP26458.1 hypothetical protein [Oligoflexia bacterium]